MYKRQGHGLAEYIDAVQRIRQYPFDICTCLLYTSVLETYSRREEDAISSVLSEMQNANGMAYQDLSDRMKAYMDYVVDTLLTLSLIHI